MNHIQIEAVYSASHIGHRVQNQDHLGCFVDPLSNQALIVVADGMGGHKGGEMAAKAVVKSAEKHWQERDNISDIDAYLLALVDLAHQAVRNQQNSETPDAQSTLCALYLDKENLVSVHVGDSRVMQFDRKGLVKKTVDHSLAQLEVLKGNISEDQAAQHPGQNKLFTSIGGSNKPQPEIERFAAMDATFVICSDGFWELFTQDGMHRAVVALCSSGALETLIESKISGVKNHDNTTAIVVSIKAKEGVTELSSQHTETSTHADANKAGAFFGRKQASLLLVIFALALFLLAALLWLLPEETNNTRENEAGATNKVATSTSAPVPDSSNTHIQSSSTGYEQSLFDRVDGVEIDQNQSDNLISTLRTEMSVPVKGVDDAIEKTREHLLATNQISPDDELVAIDQTNTISGTQIIKLQQFHQGIPVYGAETISMVNANTLQKVNSKTVKDISVDLQPKLSSSETIALTEEKLQSAFTLLKDAQLTIFENDNVQYLAWVVEVELSNNVAHRIFLDANDGHVIEQVNLVIY